MSWSSYIPAIMGGASMAMGAFGGSGGSNDYGIDPKILNILLGKREYKLDEKAMKRVVDKLDQMKATGKNITPEMYDSLYRAELQTAVDSGLKKSVAGAQIGLGYGTLSERARESDNAGQAASSAGFGELGGQLLSQSMKPKAQGGICIIVTACTNPDSEEVQIARAYRDTLMDRETLRGYYMIAELVVPIMAINNAFRAMVKTAVVDSWIEYGKYILGIIPVCSDTAKEETRGFLETCKEIGMMSPPFRRSNSEVY